MTDEIINEKTNDDDIYEALRKGLKIIAVFIAAGFIQMLFFKDLVFISSFASGALTGYLSLFVNSIVINRFLDKEISLFTLTGAYLIKLIAIAAAFYVLMKLGASVIYLAPGITAGFMAVVWSYLTKNNCWSKPYDGRGSR